MSQATTPITHPLLRCVQAVAEALDEAVGYDPDWLPAGEKADLLVDLARQAGRMAALRVRVLAGWSPRNDSDGPSPAGR